MLTHAAEITAQHNYQSYRSLSNALTSTLKYVKHGFHQSDQFCSSICLSPDSRLNENTSTVA